MTKFDDSTAYELSKVFTVTPDKLFNSFINEETLKKIWGVSEIQIDARPGGKARALLQFGSENWDFTITYKEIIQNEKLYWVVHFDRFPTKETRVTLLFNKAQNGTELIFRQENFENPNERDQNRQANEQALKTLSGLLQ